jgi:NAD(P)H-nitrite reductase large subunit
MSKRPVGTKYCSWWLADGEIILTATIYPMLSSEGQERKMDYVIIGNGIAGASAAESIRQLDPEGSITIIGDEAELPYYRPMISLVLEGTIFSEKLPVRDQNFYDELNIQALLGERVTGIDVENKSLTVGNGKPIHYDRLLIASGADPRPVKAEGLKLKNIFYMRTEAHVHQIVKALPSVNRVLVLGGGLVGFKAAYALLRRGLKVTMVEILGFPLPLHVDEQAGKLILDELVAHGLEVKLETEVVGFNGNSQVRSASLSDGTEIPCDMAIAGIGVLPALSFVPRDKIQVDLGILVNNYMQTNIPQIYAAGDVAELVDIARNIPWVNAIWPEAANQGRIAGMNMAGREVAYPGSLSRNTIRVFNMDIMVGGLVNPPSDRSYDVITSVDQRNQTYRKLVFRNDKLVGLVMVNNIEQGGILVSLVRNRTPVMIPKENFLDRSFNFKQLMPHSAHSIA